MTIGIERSWREFIRRSVVRTGTAYAAVSFVALQLGEILLPAYSVGPSGLRSLFAALLAAFPIVLAGSWVHDVSGSRPRRSSRLGSPSGDGQRVGATPSKRAMCAVMCGAVCLGAVGWWLVEGGVRWSTPPGGRPALIVAAVLMTVAWWSAHEANGEAFPTRSVAGPSIAVLPFADWGPSGPPNFLGEALADEIRGLLSAVDGLHVAARTSCPSARPPADARAVGRSLGVATLLEGSVLRNASEMRIMVHLIDTETGFRVWSGTYRHPVDSLLTGHRRVATSIVDEMLAAAVGTGHLLAG